jgi:hypothetical protein
MYMLDINSIEAQMSVVRYDVADYSYSALYDQSENFFGDKALENSVDRC